MEVGAVRRIQQKPQERAWAAAVMALVVEMGGRDVNHAEPHIW